MDTNEVLENSLISNYLRMLAKYYKISAYMYKNDRDIRFFTHDIELYQIYYNESLKVAEGCDPSNQTIIAIIQAKEYLREDRIDKINNFIVKNKGFLHEKEKEEEEA